MSISDKVNSVSPDDLDALLDRAYVERWSQLALIGPSIQDDIVKHVADKIGRSDRVYRLSESVEGFATKLLPLTNLRTLDLRDNGIGDEGARAVAALSNLTSLNLWGNGIGEEGARAVAALSNLTSLNLPLNGIGGIDPLSWTPDCLGERSP